MTRISLRGHWLSLVAVAAVVACGDSTGLPPASVENVVDTATLFALHGTDVGTASGYDIPNRYASRTQLGEVFDFAFDIDSAGSEILKPSSLLGRTTSAGLQISELPFDSILEAPDDGYVTDEALAVTPDMTFLARSRAVSALCGFLGSLPRYGKFRVLAIDQTDRTVTLEIMVNQNCGYRQLEPGIPTH